MGGGGGSSQGWGLGWGGQGGWKLRIIKAFVKIQKKKFFWGGGGVGFGGQGGCERRNKVFVKNQIRVDDGNGELKLL